MKKNKSSNQLKKGADYMETHEIIIENNQDIIDIDEELKGLMNQAINKVLSNENFENPAEVSVTFVNDSEIRELNKQFRDKDISTDVLSFPMLEFDEEKNPYNDIGDVNRDNNKIVLGDIVISTETAKRQAEEYNHSINREVIFLVVHSVLHLMGYDHEKGKDEFDLMRKKEEEVLSNIGLKRD